MELRVKDEENYRIDKYLSLNTSFSRELITKLLTTGDILVNDKKVKPSYKVKINDLITINAEKTLPKTVEKEDISLDIVYEDKDIMVINKPSGLVVHPGSGNASHTLVNALLNHTPNLSTLGGIDRPGIVHRLDKDTSGLMLVAKTNAAHEILANDFRNKKIHREYIALLMGVFPHNKARIDAPIARDKKIIGRYKVASSGKSAITNLEVITKFKKYTLVRLILETGRTHQIRVHLSYIGYPIYNDPIYTKNKCTSFGQFLHSEYLEFIHPITKEKLSFRAKLPQEFQDFLNQIKEDEEENKIA